MIKRSLGLRGVVGLIPSTTQTGSSDSPGAEAGGSGFPGHPQLGREPENRLVYTKDAQSAKKKI